MGSFYLALCIQESVICVLHQFSWLFLHPAIIWVTFCCMGNTMCVCIYVCVGDTCTLLHIHVEVKGQLYGVRFLLPPLQEFWGLESPSLCAKHLCALSLCTKHLYHWAVSLVLMLHSYSLQFSLCTGNFFSLFLPNSNFVSLTNFFLIPSPSSQPRKLPLSSLMWMWHF